MSREQRRANRKQQARAGTPASPRAVSRRTPVKAPGSSGPPWALIGVFGSLLAVVLLVVYLIVQAASGEEGLSGPEKAEQDASPGLPGVFHPTQGRSHFNYTYSPDREPRPFCAGVPASDSAAPSTTPSGSATATRTPAPTPSPAATASGTPGSTTPQATATVPTDCYATNPPSSGQHLPAQRNVDLGNGARINIPPDPDVYPEDIVIPREAIAHILEHAGVFAGYNCADGDTACAAVVEKLTDLVNDRIDNHNDRVVMSRDPDLPIGEIGLASWTRVLNFAYEDFDQGAVEDFIGTHACRFDPEGFCG